MYAHTRLVTSARDSGSLPTMAPSSGLGVTSCAMPPRTALDASAPAGPVLWGDGVLVARAFFALACLACAIRDLLERGRLGRLTGLRLPRHEDRHHARW